MVGGLCGQGNEGMGRLQREPGYKEVGSLKPCEKCIDQQREREGELYWEGLRPFARLGLETFSEAFSDFEAELEPDPQFPDAWIGKVLALVGLGRVDDALEALDIAIALDPNYTDAIEAKQALELMR